MSSPETLVKRPSLSLKSKRGSSSRLSFGQGESATDDIDDNDVSVFKPKKSNLSRLAIEKNAERKARASLLGEEELVLRRAEQSNDRPSYDKEYLEELKASTPSTPRATTHNGDNPSDEKSEERDKEENDDEAVRPLDIESKFGAAAVSLSTRKPNPKFSIPTDAEIREKKERRARLAKEHEADHIALEDNEEDDSNSDPDIRRDITIRHREKYPETRLLPEDEDMAEGFDEFVSDGKISLGKREEREAKQKRRIEMAAMIAEAEGGGKSTIAGAIGNLSGDSSVDESEEERNAAFEAAQTKSGTYSASTTVGRKRKGGIDGPQMPPRITPIPELGTVLINLKDKLARMQQDLDEKEQRLKRLKEDRRALDERGDWIQGQLKEAGEKFEKMREMAGSSIGNGEEEKPENAQLNGTHSRLSGAESTMTGRGLETLGTVAQGDAETPSS